MRRVLFVFAVLFLVLVPITPVFADDKNCKQDAKGFLAQEVCKQEEIKTSGWIERQLAGLIAGTAREFYGWMDKWGLKDPYMLVTADDPKSPAIHLGLNSRTVQDAKEIIYDKFYRSAALPIAALLIVVAGFQFAVAADDEGRNRAKETILALLTFFFMIFAIDVIFQFLVSLELSTVNLLKGAISSASGIEDNEYFRKHLFGDNPIETMKAIRSLGLAVVALLFVFFMLRMNYIYIVRMISLVLIVAILPFVAALSVWPRFRASLSMLFREFFAQLFLPIGHMAVLIAMYFVVNHGNSFYIIPFVFSMGAMERILREVLGVDGGFGARFGLGAFNAIAGTVAIARGVDPGRILRGAGTVRTPPPVERPAPPPPPPPRTDPMAGTGPGPVGRPPASPQPVPGSGPVGRPPASPQPVPGSGPVGRPPLSSQPAPLRDGPLTSGSIPREASPSAVAYGRPGAGGTGGTVDWGGTGFGTRPVPAPPPAPPSRFTLRRSPLSSPPPARATLVTPAGGTFRGRKDWIGPMSEYRRDVKAPLEPYTPNMYASPGRERALQAIRQGVRLTGRAASRGLSAVSRKMPDAFAAAARTTAGVVAGATMYTLTGENEVAAVSAFQAASIADRAARSTLRAGGALYRGGERFVRWDLGRIDAETARRMQAAPRATARFRETLRGGNFPGTRTV